MGMEWLLKLFPNFILHHKNYIIRLNKFYLSFKSKGLSGQSRKRKKGPRGTRAMTFQIELYSALSPLEPQPRTLSKSRTSVSDKNKGLPGAIVYPWKIN